MWCGRGGNAEKTRRPCEGPGRLDVSRVFRMAVVVVVAIVFGVLIYTAAPKILRDTCARASPRSAATLYIAPAYYCSIFSKVLYLINAATPVIFTVLPVGYVRSERFRAISPSARARRHDASSLAMVVVAVIVRKRRAFVEFRGAIFFPFPPPPTIPPTFRFLMAGRNTRTAGRMCWKRLMGNP